MIEENNRKGQGQWANKILARDRQCQLCDAKENLQAHHKDGNPENNSLQNGVTLCGKCNMKMERILHNPDLFLPSNLTYMGIHRHLADLGRRYKILSASILNSPLDLIGLKNSIEQIQQQTLKATNTKNGLTDDKFNEDDIWKVASIAGFVCGQRFSVDLLEAATKARNGVVLEDWFRVNEKEITQMVEALICGVSSQKYKWEIVKEPKP